MQGTCAPRPLRGMRQDFLGACCWQPPSAVVHHPISRPRCVRAHAPRFSRSGKDNTKRSSHTSSQPAVASLPSAAKSASSSARCAAGVPREGQCAGRESQARKSEAAAQKAPQEPVPASTRAEARDGSASERTCALISSSMLGCTATLLILSASSAGLRRRLPDCTGVREACVRDCWGAQARTSWFSQMQHARQLRWVAATPLCRSPWARLVPSLERTARGDAALAACSTRLGSSVQLLALHHELRAAAQTPRAAVGRAARLRLTRRRRIVHLLLAARVLASAAVPARFQRCFYRAGWRLGCQRSACVTWRLACRAADVCAPMLRRPRAGQRSQVRSATIHAISTSCLVLTDAAGAQLPL